MEKISKIIPTSRRLQAEDLNSSQPVRPGAPSFGRPMGRNSIGEQKARVIIEEEARRIADRITLSDDVTAQPPTSKSVYKDSTENKKTKMIDELSKKFFENPKTMARDSDYSKSEEVITQMEANT